MSISRCPPQHRRNLSIDIASRPHATSTRGRELRYCTHRTRVVVVCEIENGHGIDPDHRFVDGVCTFGTSEESLLDVDRGLVEKVGRDITPSKRHGIRQNISSDIGELERLKKKKL